MCLVVLTTGVLAVSTPASAQKEFETYYAMQAMNDALGVTCVYCHTTGPDKRANYKSNDNPRKAVARKMIEMTADINAKVFLATGSEASKGSAVTCVTCHRGVPIPVPIAQLVQRAIELEGAEAGVRTYRELRGQFYERDVYDFTEAELLRMARSYVDRLPDAAIALARMNLDWRPASASTYVLLGYAYTRKFDDEAAIALFEKALDLDAENGAARGYLHQLRQFRNLK